MSVIRKPVPLGAGWKYCSGSVNGTTLSKTWHLARPLPTNIHLDLLADGLIPDPFITKNEEQVQWIGEQTWIYETSFKFAANPFPRGHEKTVLVFEGLDTFATVKLNGLEILTAKNMFLCHRVEVTKEMLNLEGNTSQSHTLQIVFENAERKGHEEVAKHPDHKWLTFDSSATRLAVRKAQYHYVSFLQFLCEIRDC